MNKKLIEALNVLEWSADPDDPAVSEAIKAISEALEEREQLLARGMRYGRSEMEAAVEGCSEIGRLWLSEMLVPTTKRLEYWNHFVSRWAVEGVGGGYRVTGRRLWKIRDKMLADDDFWQDIVLRHSGLDKTPEQLMAVMPEVYNHCLGNFWGMIYQELMDARMI